MLGTGSAAAKNCYNTCFVFTENNQHFLTDAGGGNQILKRLDQNNINLGDIGHIFITHSHTDHILGAVWLVRMIGQIVNYDGCEKQFNIYCHDEAAEALKTICYATLPKSITNHFGGKIKINILNDGDTCDILNCKVKFFDIKSDKTKQFGFVMTSADNKKIVCCGDEPLKEDMFDIADGCDLLMHEAFCLYSERDIFKPYQKFHSTAKDACETAEKINAKTVLLYHTEDTHLLNRKELYIAEGQNYYHGNILVPDDNESIEI